MASYRVCAHWLLPRLTALQLVNLPVGVTALLAIASHSTLEQLHIDARGGRPHQWLSARIVFPIDTDEDQRQMAAAAVGGVLDGKAEEETEEEERNGDYDSLVAAARASPTDGWSLVEGRLAESDFRQLRTALARTQPTRRSCETRLALADWLHRRVRRAKLPTEPLSCFHTLSGLRHCRRQVALLRSTLLQQLGTAAAEVAPVYEIGPVDDPSATGVPETELRPSKRARTE